MSSKTGLSKTNKKSNPTGLMIWGSALITIFIHTSFYDPFNTPKFILLILLGGLLLGYLVNSYRESPVILNRHIFKPLFIIGIFLAFLLISTILTDVRYTGFFGESQRKNGMLTYLALSIILLYASQSMNLKSSLSLIRIAIFTGLMMSLYGLIQISGNDFVEWVNPYNSMISTLGNPNFASAMLAIFASFATFSLVLKQINLVYKYASVVMIVLSLIAIIRSDSRQGLITYFLSLLFYFSIYLYLTKRKLGITAIVISLGLSALIVAGMLQKGPLERFLYKDSVSVRGYYWRAGFEMFKDNPFFGVGVDRYGAFFKQYRESNYPLKYGFDISSSNAHNTIVQFFATSGVFVGLAYLTLLIYVFVTGLILVKKLNSEDQKIVLALLSAWIGFQAQSFISIDNIGISIWGWLLSGTILGISRSLSVVKPINTDLLGKKSRKNLVKINIFQPLVSLVALIPILFISYFLVKSENESQQARNLTNNSVPQNAPYLMTSARKVLDNPFADPYYKLLVVTFMNDMGFKEESRKEMQLLLKKDPRNLNSLQIMAGFQRLSGDVIGEIKNREEIAKFDPFNAPNYLELAKLYLSAGDKKGVTELRNKVLSFAPNASELNLINEILSEN